MSIHISRLQSPLFKKNADFVAHRLRYGTFYSLRYKYLYVETPKCACTKTKAILWEVEGLEKKEPWPQIVHNRSEDDGRLSLSDLAETEAVHAITSSEVFRFCVRRDPVRRLVSAYLTKIADLVVMECESTRKLIRETYGLATNADITFDHFAEFVCAQEDQDRDPHWMTQSRITLSDIIPFDFVASVENYNEDMTYILKQIGAPDYVLETVQERINFSGSERTQVTQETQKLIRQTYQVDTIQL
jgi:hypothetical protein